MWEPSYGLCFHMEPPQVRAIPGRSMNAIIARGHAFLFTHHRAGFWLHFYFGGQLNSIHSTSVYVSTPLQRNPCGHSWAKLCGERGHSTKGMCCLQTAWALEAWMVRAVWRPMMAKLLCHGLSLNKGGVGGTACDREKATGLNSTRT